MNGFGCCFCTCGDGMMRSGGVRVREILLIHVRLELWMNEWMNHLHSGNRSIIKDVIALYNQQSFSCFIFLSLSRSSDPWCLYSSDEWSVFWTCSCSVGAVLVGWHNILFSWDHAAVELQWTKVTVSRAMFVSLVVWIDLNDSPCLSHSGCPALSNKNIVWSTYF